MSTRNKSLLLLALFSTANVLPTDLPMAIAETYSEQSDAGLKYAEYIFIVKPSNTVKAHASKTLATLILLSAGGVLANSYRTGRDVSLNSLNVLAISGISGITYNWYYEHLENSVKHATLVEFIKNYEELHRDYIDDSLLPLFDEVANISVDRLNRETVNQVFEVILHVMEHEFAKRYEKDKQKSTDILSAAKSITDIYKNLK